MSGSKTVRVDEIFGPVVQGEGPLAGSITYFVRLGGCSFRCAWCDTLHAVLPEYRHNWKPMTAQEIVNKVSTMVPGHGVRHSITISGGNPANQDCSDLISALQESAFKVTMETQGDHARPWMRALDMLVVSPKPPSSGMDNDLEVVAQCFNYSKRHNCALKLVVGDDIDFDWAIDTFNKLRTLSPTMPPILYMQPVTINADGGPADLLKAYRWLCEKSVTIAEDVRVIPQLHALAYGNERGR